MAEHKNTRLHSPLEAKYKRKTPGILYRNASAKHNWKMMKNTHNNLFGFGHIVR